MDAETIRVALREAKMEEKSRLSIERVREALLGLPFISDVRLEPSQMKDRELVVMEVRYHDVCFEDLVKVSKALGTTRINLDNQVREGGYCETCRYSYSVTVLTAWDAVLAEN